MIETENDCLENGVFEELRFLLTTIKKKIEI